MKSFLVALFVVVSYPLIVSFASAQPAVDRLERKLRDREPADEAAADKTGYLGIFAEERADDQGIELTRVMADSPAAKAGLETGDLVTKIGDQPIRNLDDFAAAMQDEPVGKTLRFTLERKGEPTVVNVTLGTRPPKKSRPFPNFGRIDEPGPVPPRTSLLGVRVEGVDEQAAAESGAPSALGALVVGVEEGSPAANAGIPVGAVIVAADGRAIRSPADLKQLIAASQAGQEIRVGFYSRGKIVERRVRLAELMAEQSLIDDVEPQPQLPIGRRLSDAQRIEQLERRIEFLEARLAELERLVGRN